MWIVELHYRGAKPWTKVVCGCDSEQAAQNAGKILAWMYNNPDVDYAENVVIFSMFEYYTYTVKYHEGEWVHG